jgi:hypothetical protein
MVSKGVYGTLASVAALSVFALAQPASALTMKQCSEKYKSASDAGAVGSATWNDFRKAECGEGQDREGQDRKDQDRANDCCGRTQHAGMQHKL